MRTVLRIIVLGFGSLCLGILVNQISHPGIRWHVLLFSLPRISHQQNFNYISADSAHVLLIEKKGLFVDIRSSDEFLLDHIPGARSAPYIEMLKQPGLLQDDSSYAVVVCYGFDPEDRGVQQAADLLKRSGFSEIRILHDGFAGWIEMGYPVEKMDGQ